MRITDITCPRSIDPHTWENFLKVFDNEMEHYEKHPPFQTWTDTSWRMFISMFHSFRLVRRLIGGIWIRGEEFGMWLQTTKHFPNEWLARYEHEVWGIKKK